MFYRVHFGARVTVYVWGTTIEQAIDAATVWVRQEYRISDPPTSLQKYVGTVTREPWHDRNWEEMPLT